MTEPAPLILSASTIKVWVDCHYRYLLEHVHKVPAAPNMDMAIGTAVHAGVEALHKAAQDPLQATRSAFGRELASMSAYDDEEALRAQEDVPKMFRTYTHNILPTFRPTMVERPFLIRVDGVHVSGQIDAADEVLDEVHDTKTTATPSKIKPERHQFQMSLYRWAYRVLTGRFPKRLVLDVVARNGRWKQIEVEPDDQGMVELVKLTADGIMRSEFDPTGALSGACARCPYATGVCRFAATR